MSANDPRDPSDPRDASSRQLTRVPLDAEVQLEFENFSGFIREVSANLSLGGMFVKTRYLKPVGTTVRFEFRLKDHYRLIRGTGEVVWTRWRDQPPAQPAGMGIQFAELDAESRTLVAAIVDQHARSGGSPFDVDRTVEPDPEDGANPAAYAPGLPAATGPGISDHQIASWVRDQKASSPLDPEEPSAPIEPDHQVEIAFVEPPELPPAPVPFFPAGTSLEPVGRERPVASARPLDWGAAEAMAALGISPAGAAAEPRLDRANAPVAVPDLGLLVPPEPRVLFGGGAASSANGSRIAVRVLVPLGLVGLGVVGWFLLPGHRRSEPATVAVVDAKPAPAAARPQPTAAAPAPVAPVSPLQAAPVGAPASSAPASTAASAASARAIADAAGRPPTVPASAPEPAAAAAVGAGEGFSAVDRITWQAAGGETEVVLWTNGVVSSKDVEHVRIEQPEAREVLKLHGVNRSFSPSQLAVNNPELRQIRVGFHEQKPYGQLHVVFDLAASDVRILSMRADGSRLRVRLGRE